MDGRTTPVTIQAPPRLLEPTRLASLVDALRAQGYRVIAPVRRDNAIVYDEIESAADLPIGWTDEQSPATYRLTRRGDQAWFGYAVGPHSWKRFLHPPVLRLWSAQRRNDHDFLIQPENGEPPKMAFLGVRPCELAAIARLDQVLRDGPFPDPAYASRRRDLLVIAVDCTEPRGTCFCESMGTGPGAGSGFDISLTELVGANEHAFVAHPGSEAGAALLASLDAREATDEEVAAAHARVEAARGRMGRTLETSGLEEALLRQSEHPRWEKIAARCLTCGNCTMSCPTCFCTTVEETSDLTGTRAERWRKWDSCFSVEFSYMYGGSVRLSARSRYRQWLTHKLATWRDQFGVSGCVGCGRCITWCPVGIDITVEAQAIREAGGAPLDVSGQEPTHGDHRATAG
jgi:Fe-S-cluster-containing hydrogenase component 2